MDPSSSFIKNRRKGLLHTSQSNNHALSLPNPEFSIFPRSTTHIHFPPASEYTILKYREARVLARFRYLVPSFRVDKGIESVKLSSVFLDKTKGENARKAVKKIMVAMKLLKTAVNDFQIFRMYITVYQASQERAATYRLHAMGGDVKDRFLMGIAAIIGRLDKRTGKTISTDIVKGKGKERTASEDFVVVDVPEF